MATYRKTSTGWRAEVCIGGIRKSKTKPTKAEARAWAADTEHALRQQGEGVSSTHTLAQVFVRYEAEISEHKKGARWEQIRFRAWRDLPLSRVRLIDLRREHIEDYIAQRLRGDSTQPGVKSSTVNRELNLLSHCLTQARRWRLMAHNPMDDLQRPRNPPHRDRRVLPREQEAILLALGYSETVPVKTQMQRAASCFLFALETAMRAGEICGLLPEHIDLDARTAYLPDTKNGYARSVPLSTEALRILKRQEPWLPGKPIFRLSAGTLSSLFKRGTDRSGVEGLTFHDSRHEAITRLAKKLDVLDLARMVGHRDIKQLMTYYNKTAAELALQLD